MRKARFCNEEHAFEIRVYEFIPVFLVRVFEFQASRVDARAVEDVVEAA